MDILLPVIVGTFCTGVGLHLLTEMGLIRWGGRARARLRRQAARAAGLSDVEESRGALAGREGTLRVRLSSYGFGRVYGTRITVSGPGLPSDLTVRPERDLVPSVRSAPEIEIGDDAFDNAAWVQGSPAVVRAVLDSGNRRAIRALFEGRLERPGRSPFWATGRIDEGVLRVDVPEVAPHFRDENAVPWGTAVGRDYVGGLERLPEVLPVVLALARRLQAPQDVPRRLGDSLKTEPEAGVRVQLLATLEREFPGHPATRAALLAAREDPDAEVRLRAGIALGSEGRDVLLAIAGGVGAPDETTQRAVAALGRHLTTPEAEAILRKALRARREGTARACLGALGQRRGAPVVPTLAKVLAVEKPELAAAAADALGATGDTAAERALLPALGSPHAAVRLAAAQALGRVGTIAAVGPLRETESGDSNLRRAARHAIAEIQARLAGAEPGQLSLAAGESGQLSLAAGEGGALSLAEGERGSPSVGERAR